MGKVTGNSAKAAAIVGFLIILCGIGISTCGFIWVAYNGYQGHGLWSGIPHLVTGFFGLLSLTKSNLVFTLYLLLCVVTSIAAGIQAVTGGLELQHWSKFIGDKKCSVIKGFCECIGFEQIRIKNLDSCDKIPTINDLFITIIFFSICGALLCVSGAIAGCVGLATIPRSQPTTLPRKPKPKQIYSANTMPLNPPPNQSNDVRKPDHVDAGYPVVDTRPRYDDREPPYKEKDRYDDRRDDYYNERERDNRYNTDYPRDTDRRDDYYYKDNISDRSYDREYDRDYHKQDYDRGYDRDYDRDYDRRSYEDRRTPPPDSKTYL